MGHSLSTSGKAPAKATVATPRKRENGRPHVCIVGAGMSGLKCADTLLGKGAKVTVYEARDRTGGRVHQSSKLGHLVDL